MIIAADIDHGSEEASGGKIRALVVDPDPPGRIQMITELEKLGWECQAAASGNQMVEPFLAITAGPLMRSVLGRFEERMSRASADEPSARRSVHGSSGICSSPISERAKARAPEPSACARVSCAHSCACRPPDRIPPSQDRRCPGSRSRRACSVHSIPRLHHRDHPARR